MIKTRLELIKTRLEVIRTSWLPGVQSHSREQGIGRVGEVSNMFAFW